LAYHSVQGTKRLTARYDFMTSWYSTG
jgi:hypothetical protein